MLMQTRTKKADACIDNLFPLKNHVLVPDFWPCMFSTTTTMVENIDVMTLVNMSLGVLELPTYDRGTERVRLG